MAVTSAEVKKRGTDGLAPDCHGENLYHKSPAFRTLLKHYLNPRLHAHLKPHFERLGEIADVDQPILHPRSAFGRHAD